MRCVQWWEEQNRTTVLLRAGSTISSIFVHVACPCKRVGFCWNSRTGRKSLSGLERDSFDSKHWREFLLSCVAVCHLTATATASCEVTQTCWHATARRTHTYFSSCQCSPFPSYQTLRLALSWHTENFGPSVFYSTNSRIT